MNYLIFRTSWGWMGVAGTGSGLRYLVLPCLSTKEVEEALFKSRQNTEDRKQDAEAPEFQELVHRLERYFNGYKVDFTDRIDIAEATPFQKEVWLALRDIPYGKTISYSELANRLGKPKAARAIGQALTRNPLPIILPCHRVIGRNGELVGYGGGIGLKKSLLELEAHLPVPDHQKLKLNHL